MQSLPFVDFHVLFIFYIQCNHCSELFHFLGKSFFSCGSWSTSRGCHQWDFDRELSGEPNDQKMGPANIGRGRTLGMSLQSVIHKGFTLMFQSQKITKDGCGKTKSCYSEPANCKSSKDCEYLATIKPEGDQCESVEFELSTKKQWGAIGFNSEKNKMVRKINCSY